MSTTPVTPLATERAAAERAAANKSAQTKPNGPPNSAQGQFAALMLLQTDEDSAAGMIDATAQAPAEDADAERSKADDRPCADAAQQALQTLLDWRGLINGTPTNASQAATPHQSNTPDSQFSQRSGAPLADAKTASDSKALGLSADGASSGKTAQKADNAGSRLTDMGTWTAPSPQEAAELQAALGKAMESPPTGDTARAQPTPAAISSSGADLAGPSPLSKARPGSTKTNPIGAVRTATAATAEVATGAPAATTIGKMAEPAAHTRSTLDLVNRSDTTESVAQNAAEQAGVLEPTAVSKPQGPDAPAGEGIQQAEFKHPVPTATPDSPPTPAPEAFADAFQQHMNDVNAQISYWTAQGAQRASFTIGSNGDNPVEVKLSFTDGELAVSFETDEESVREVLQNGAQEALQRMMDAQGIALGNVSVGSGRPNTPQENPAERPTVALGQRGRGLKAITNDAQVSPAPRAPQIMTATKLDFYA